jgi:hypothetical protein
MPSSFPDGVDPSAFRLQRRAGPRHSGNRLLDWVALALAVLAPPVGLLVGIGAVVSGARSRGYSAGIARAAIGIGVALSLVLGVAIVVVGKITRDEAARAAIVASSRAYCAKIDSHPGLLSGDTFGWPAPGGTIPSSITAIESYEAYWSELAKLAPTGIRSDTEKVAATADSIVATVQSTQTLNDGGNVAQLQNVVATSGIRTWVSTYCN